MSWLLSCDRLFYLSLPGGAVGWSAIVVVPGHTRLFLLEFSPIIFIRVWQKD